MAAAVAGDAVRPRLDDPGLPARARRAQLHAGADADLPRDDGGPPASRARATSPATRSSRRACSSSATTRRRQLAPAAIRGDTIWCIGMSEPNAGSDLAGLQTRAEVFDDHFVVNGQKVWTSYAQIAQKCFCYVRTDPTWPSTEGISLLIIDMDTPGIEVRPLAHITRQGRLRRGVLHRRRWCRARTSSGALNGGWAHHAGFARARARRACGSKASSRFEQTVDGARRRSRAAPAATTTRSCAARSRRPTSSRRACARSATRASRRSPRARRRPSTRT